MSLRLLWRRWTKWWEASVWQEWTVGVGGRNALTPAVRSNKFNRNRWTERKPIYHLLQLLVSSNKIPARAIKIVEDAYCILAWAL